MLVGEYTAMVKLTCVSVMALKHYLLEFNWYRAITQCTWHSYSCGQTVGWIKIPLGKEIGLGPGHIMLAGDPVGAQPPTAAPPHFRLMPIVAKRSPISATAELLLRYCKHPFSETDKQAAHLLTNESRWISS